MLKANSYSEARSIMSRRNLNALKSAAAAACLCLSPAVPPLAQGDLTGGVGQFAIQPKREKSVVSAKPKPVKGKTGPRATAADRLVEAASRGDSAAATAALGSGANANARSDDGCPALVYAAAGKNSETAQALLAKGADANAKCADGVTALMVAAEVGDAATVQAL